MDQDIQKVQDAEQLRRWISYMCNSSNAIYVALSSAQNTDHFTYEHQSLSITDVVDAIADKTDVLVGMYPRIDIENLKRKFIFDDPTPYFDEPTPHSTSLAQLVANLQKMNETPCCFSTETRECACCRWS